LFRLSLETFTVPSEETLRLGDKLTVDLPIKDRDSRESSEEEKFCALKILIFDISNLPQENSDKAPQDQ
jgi:hypothetical protein